MKNVISYILLGTVLVFCILQFNKYETDDHQRQLWKEDFDYIINKIEEVHPNPYRVNDRNYIENEFNKLVTRSTCLTNEEIYFEVSRIIALYKDGHTSILWHELNSEFFYPIYCSVIDDKVYVTSSIKKYEDILYNQVISINGKNINDVIRKISAYINAENENFVELCTERMMFNKAILQHIGVIGENDDLILELMNNRKVSFVTIEDMKSGEIAVQYILERDLSGVVGTDNYRFKYYKDERILYFKYRKCFDDEIMPFDIFEEKFWAMIADYEVDKIIVDISYNLGGDPELIKSMFNDLALSEYNSNDRLFVVIGKGNYSAATQLAAMFKRLTGAELIGSPTGGSTKMTFDVVEFITPNHNIGFNVATREFEVIPNSTEMFIRPDVEIPFTIEHYKEGIDPYLEYVKSR